MQDIEFLLIQKTTSNLRDGHDLEGTCSFNRHRIMNVSFIIVRVMSFLTHCGVSKSDWCFVAYRMHS